MTNVSNIILEVNIIKQGIENNLYKANALSVREQSAREEIANSLSHGIGLAAAVAAMPVLILATVRQGSAAAIVGATIFSITMVFVYLTSTLYHALPEGAMRRWLLKLDHGAIYLFIAGSYTPFALGAPERLRDWLLFGLVWCVAFVGVALKASGQLARPLYSTGLYLGMGWLVLLAAYPLAGHITSSSLSWLISGGVAYTVGVFFFASDARVRFNHFIWHLFVMLGSACHFLAVLGNFAR